ncbi:TonB-dependent receptor [Sphingomonas aracearum]|uniref:TonB-dependent receptor n=1 Tax=Sphingomonas aracearum TaxID=2283317 RepID=A0A369VZU2_9SPHN|nr:carboxypeptidase regulatory-like domain-containing protein [Sphingomonas aracearum]RDE07145.1 TonB-dependent receptor [Sphingomonas aracearum]
MRHQFLLGAAAAALVVPVAAHAQETTSQIRGTVTDDAGAPVAGATITVRNTATGATNNSSTDNEGRFLVSGLQPGGPYSVDVNATQGTTQVTDIYTVVAQAFDLPITLATTTGDIVVTASSIQGAGVTSDGPQTLLTQRDISKVASVNRDIRDLERRSPFATLDLSNSRAVTFAGVNPRFNRFTINGVQIGDSFGLNPDVNPTGRGPIPFDAISQFSVSIAPFDIRQGNFAGGVIDTVMRSGTNEYFGTGFYSQSTDGLQGDRIGDSAAGRLTLPKYKSETYGATLAGPIIKDKLFVMVSAERNTDPRPLSVASLNQIPGYNAGVLSNVQGIASSRYGYTTGDFVTVNNQKDEKIVGKIDWNIMDGQRLSISYINAFETSTVANGTSANASGPVIGLASNYYTSSNLVRSGIVQLNSDWTDNLSTEARGLYQWTRRGQDSLLGTGFPQIRVCTDPTSVTTAANNQQTSCGTTPIVAFGPDNSRQSNQLFFDTWGGSLLTRYTAGGHEVKLLVEYNESRSYNLFLQNSAGNYYFDSIADFQAGNASGYNLQVPTQGDLSTVAADFKYGQYTFGLQDDWRITDRLTLTYGARYDLFGMRDTPALNTAFLARNGFTNTKTYKGLDNFQPRISADWQARDWLKLRGGVGIFGGGSPNIYLSNSFSNTGVLSNALNSSTNNYGIIRNTAAADGSTATCTGAFTGANAGVCTAALNGVTGATLSPAVVNYLVNNTGSLAAAPTASLAQDIRLPSVMKATFSADANVYGINIGGDFLYTDTLSAPAFTDIRSVVVGRLPDGRPRYASKLGASDSNNDFQFYNENRGRGFVAVGRFDKTFDFGLSLSGSYTFQDVKDVSPATASTPSSLYGQQSAADPNFATYGTSSDETKWAWKYGVGFDHAFYRDYRTVIQLFGETRAGRHYSFTMQDNGNGTRSPVFGTTGNNNRYLLYVPTGASDPLVTYADDATRNSLEGLINNTALKNYRGRIAPKNIARSRAFTRIDLHLEQEIPTFLGKSRITLFGDIENLPNLLNSDWGGLRQLGFPYTASTVNVTCLNAAGAVLGGNIGAAATTTNPAGNPAGGCAKYRYSTFQNPNETVLSTTNSLYLIRLGARFTF